MTVVPKKKKRSFPEISRRGKRSCGGNWVTDLERSMGWRHIKVWMLQVKGRCPCISHWRMSHILPIKGAKISDNPFLKVWHHAALSLCTLLLFCCLILKEISGHLQKCHNFFTHFYIHECEHAQLVRTVRDSLILYCKFCQQRDFICNCKKRCRQAA